MHRAMVSSPDAVLTEVDRIFRAYGPGDGEKGQTEMKTYLRTVIQQRDSLIAATEKAKEAAEKEKEEEE